MNIPETELFVPQDFNFFAGFFIQAVGEKDCEEFRKISDGIERIQKPNTKTRLAADCLSFLKLQELSKHYYR